MLMHKLSAHYRNFRIFKFSKNDISGYKKIKDHLDVIVDYVSAVSCIQNESKYLQCSFSNLLSTEKKYFTVGIYDLSFNEKKNFNLAQIEAESFTKIIYIKNEIAVYICFNIEQNNAPTLLIKKLDIIRKGFLNDVITNKENIIENIGYDIDIGTFSSDAIKIDDMRFVVFFTIKSTYNLLLCLFDFNKDYTGIRVRYYVLNFDSINIQITVNIRAFLFKDYFGLLFYNSVSQFPGYIFFNYVKIISNKIDSRTIKINNIGINSLINFSFLENLEIINNIYNGPIKIRIESFSTKEESGISTKSLNLNSEISIGDILDLNDSLIFETNNGQLHDYFLEFLPIVQEIDVRSEIYGNYEENDFEQTGYFTKYTFNIIIPYGQNCSDEDYVYIKNEQEKFCLVSCDSYKEKKLYKDERENICYNFCSEAKNGNIYTYLYTCVLNCPSEYIPDKNNICIPNETMFTTNMYIGEEIEEFEENSQSNHNLDKLDEKLINSNKAIDLDRYNDKLYERLNELIKKIQNITDIGPLLYELMNKDPSLNFALEENSSWVSYSYSTDTDPTFLEKIFPGLTIVKVNECKNKLIAEHLINNDTDIIIQGRQDINDFNKFEYDLYLSNGTKLNKSLCENTKIEISKPISPNIKAMAQALNDQGYDMFDLSSNLYTDNCIPVELNESDVTLGTRQKDIMSAASSVCQEGCYYENNNLDSNRVSCSCDYDFDKKNKTVKEEKEEVKENFFSYIFNMINYKILSCFDIMNNWQNYFSNYGFLVGAIIYLMIVILFIIYLCRGNNAIKIKYLHHEPQIDEKNKKSYVIDLSDISKKFKLSSSRNNIVIEDNTLFDKPKPKKKKNKIKPNPPNNITRKHSPKSKQEININNSKKIKKVKNKRTKRIKSKIKDNEIQSKIIISIDEQKEKEETNNIEYNELTYAKALIKDERNIWQIFISYFNSKIELIQIIFYPKEFDHFSLTLTLFLYELLIDFTLNALFFSDDIISQKYYNNGNLLFITSNILSIASNIFSSLFIYLIEFLVNYNEILDAAKQETNSEKLFYKIFFKIYKLISCKIRIFYFFVFISGFCCVYYLLIFCAIYRRIQKNLFINYIIGTMWSFGYKFIFSILSTIMRKISLIKKYKRLYLIAKFIDEKL